MSFGAAVLPIKLVDATESRSASSRQIHVEDGGRIRYRKVGDEAAPSEIGKAYEATGGAMAMLPITDEDLAARPLPTAKTIEIGAFVPADDIAPLQRDGAYAPSTHGVPAAKPYALLHEVLKHGDKEAVAKSALRGRERPDMLRVVDAAIPLRGLLRPDEFHALESDDGEEESRLTPRHRTACEKPSSHPGRASERPGRTGPSPPSDPFRMPHSGHPSPPFGQQMVKFLLHTCQKPVPAGTLPSASPPT